MVRAIPLLIVDNDHLQRQCLAIALEASRRFTPITLAGNAGEALWRVKAASPEVALVRWDLPGQIAPELARQVSHELPVAKVLLLGVPEGPLFVAEHVRKACAAYVPRQASLEELIAVIEQVLDGKTVGPPPVSPIAAARGTPLNGQARDGPSAPTPSLTPREQEIHALLQAGLTNKEIAAWLHVSLHTVKNHVHNLLGKLGLPDRHTAARTFRAGH
jgi:DNA-binding NarL/FixJ family response regulator